MRTALRWVIGIVVVGLLSLGLFMAVTRDNGAVPVRLVAVEKTALTSNLSTNGKVEPIDPRELHALTAGNLVKVAVKEGDRVRAGQVLAQLDRTEAASEMAHAESELRGAQTDLGVIEKGGTSSENIEVQSLIAKATIEQQEATKQLGISERLAAKNAAPRAEVDAAKERLNKANQDLSYLMQRARGKFTKEDRDRAHARVNDAEASLKLARQREVSTVATSPVNGIVYSLPVRTGNFVNRGDLLAKVADLSKLRIKVFVDEPELGRVAIGQDITITWDAIPGAVWHGKIERMPAEVVLQGTRSVGEVECVIDNKDGRLLPGVNVNVEIVSQRKSNALALPKEAVVAAPGHHYVFVYSDGKVHRKEIKIGISDVTRVEVLEGLSEGQSVAIGGETRLTDGMRVKVGESGG